MPELLYTPKHLDDQILTARSALEGEHKIVPVLFADVANLGEARSRGGPPRLWP